MERHLDVWAFFQVALEIRALDSQKAFAFFERVKEFEQGLDVGLKRDLPSHRLEIPVGRVGFPGFFGDDFLDFEA